MDELISRQAAIDAVNAYLGLSAVSRTIQNMTNIQEILERLPTAHPEPKRGQWINGYCSECGEHAPYWAMASAYHTTDFCPNCGAKMEVTE